MQLIFLDGEYWYGGCVKFGCDMPICAGVDREIDFETNKTPNQSMPLLLSSKGRVLWRETGFKVSVTGGHMTVPDDCVLEVFGDNLRSAYMGAMKKYFPFSGRMPARQLFEKPIYNTWIELTFFQSQQAVLQYARGIIDSGMPPGVLMIDDGWAQYYGQWEFHNGKFPDPKEMIKTLHDMGFHVMLWVCPFISADTVRYREARDKGLLVRTGEGKTFITEWWNGYSAVLDMTNPEAAQWLDDQLGALTDIGVDGFKFDAGDSIYYPSFEGTYEPVSADEHSRRWAQFGEKYSFNEYRVSFRAGAMALLQRLCDKTHSWGKEGAASLIPDTLIQGLTGHPFCCPDMVGGGEYLSFENLEEGSLDEELFVRHSEIACLFPAIQFSALPSRVLSDQAFAAVMRSLKVREKYLPYLLEEIGKAAVSGEPVIRCMAYVFPGEGTEEMMDQFMIGDTYLAAPVFEKGKEGREVYLPEGRWLHNEKEIVSSGERIFFSSVPGEPLVFEKV